jgi:GAF domain-containing protein/HAMP domain-containing protein
MTTFLAGEAQQLIAWLVLVLDLILAIYILLLNPRHESNRRVSALFLLLAVNILSVGLQLSEREIPQLALILTAATVPAIPPGLFIISVALVKPDWTRGRWRLLWLLVYGLLFLPIILTSIDDRLGTRMWYTPPSPEALIGGFVPFGDMTNGFLAPYIRISNLYLMGVAPIFFLIYFALLDKRLTASNRRLARLLLGVQIVVNVVQIGLTGFLGASISALISGTVLALAYAYAVFQQMLSEQRAQRGRLQPRLTLLSLAITVPLLLAVVVIVSAQTRTTLEQTSEQQLETASQSLADNLEVWLDLNLQSLQQLVTMPGIVSMDAERQKPVLEAMAAAFPHMYLVSTTDLNGTNVARSDSVEPKDYSDRPWFLGAHDGASVTFQTLIGRTSGEPALVASMPIKNHRGAIIGVGMFASDLTDVAEEVRVSRIGESGIAYVVDASNHVIAHPDQVFSTELRDLSASPPIAALRAGGGGQVSFSEGGQRWRAYVDELNHGWGIVVQQPETALLADVQGLWIVSGVVVASGILLLIVLTWLTIRQAIRPIDTLTETASAIAGGDLSHTVPVESEDEFGALSRAFNSMTEQLRAFIGGLEQQVADRTRDLEQRTAYLEATTEVGRAAASILEPDQLIQQLVELVRQRFGLYYVGLFLVDEAREWAVLRAGTGEGGPAMVARGHRIRLGEGMVGWSVFHAEARVAGEAGEDALRLASPELPDTRSEAALPLRSRGQVLGALTVQHTQSGAFDPDTMTVLQTMADQVAVALDNARLFTESQAALEAARRAYGEMRQEAWAELLQSRGEWGYRYAHQAIIPAEGEREPEMLKAEQTGQITQGNGGSDLTLAIPLKARDQVIGVLNFRKNAGSVTQPSPDTAAWTTEEKEMLAAFAAQLEVALESSRLYEDTQRRAAQDRLVGEVTARMRETLDMEAVLRTAAEAVRQGLGLPEVVVRLRGRETRAGGAPASQQGPRDSQR